MIVEPCGHFVEKGMGHFFAVSKYFCVVKVTRYVVYEEDRKPAKNYRHEI